MAPDTQKDELLLEVKNLKKYFPIRSGLLRRVTGAVKAVDGVDLFIRKGETLGLVVKVVAAKPPPGAPSSV